MKKKNNPLSRLIWMCWPFNLKVIWSLSQFRASENIARIYPLRGDFKGVQLLLQDIISPVSLMYTGKSAKDIAKGGGNISSIKCSQNAKWMWFWVFCSKLFEFLVGFEACNRFKLLKCEMLKTCSFTESQTVSGENRAKLDFCQRLSEINSAVRGISLLREIIFLPSTCSHIHIYHTKLRTCLRSFTLLIPRSAT